MAWHSHNAAVKSSRESEVLRKGRRHAPPPATLNSGSRCD